MWVDIANIASFGFNCNICSMNQSSGSAGRAKGSPVIDLRSEDEKSDEGEATETGHANATLVSKTGTRIQYVVFGKPTPLERARIARNGHMYNPSKPAQDLFKARIAGFVHEHFFEGPLKVRLVFHFKRPLYHYGTGRNSRKLKDGADHWHTKAGDIDNLAKFVLDAMNNQDDRQVAKLSAAKFYTDGRERVEVEVEKL